MNLRPFNLRRDVRRLLEECMRRHLRRDDRVYDVGCGTKPFSAFLSGVCLTHVGIDLDNGFYGNDAVDIIGVADALPVAAGTGDAVLSSQVIEHLPDTEMAMREAGRVLKPGGLLFISFPMTFPLHAAPWDFFRFTRYGFESLCARHGFEVIERHEIGGFWYMASVFSERYFNPLDRSVLKRLHVVDLATLPLHWLFRVLHAAEGGAYALAGKKVGGARRTWTVNYVYVARRTG